MVRLAPKLGWRRKWYASRACGLWTRRRTRKLRQSMRRPVLHNDVLAFVAAGSRPGWGGIRKSVCFADVARELQMSEARVAMEFKKARELGYVVATSPRQLQLAVVSTDKLDSLLGL